MARVANSLQSTTTKERAWIGRRVAAISEYTATEKMMLRLLRCTAGSKLSVASLTAVDISLKRALRHPGTLAYDEACANIKEVLRVLQERGLGELFEEYSEDKYFPGQQYLHKYTWHSIDTAARKALLDARIPSHLFGACVAPRCGSALAKEGAGTEQEAARKEKDKNVLTKKMQLPVARSGVKTLTIIVNTQLEMPIFLQETTKKLRILLGDRDEQAIVKAAHPQMDPYIHRSTGACTRDSKPSLSNALGRCIFPATARWHTCAHLDGITNLRAQSRACPASHELWQGVNSTPGSSSTSICRCNRSPDQERS